MGESSGKSKDDYNPKKERNASKKRTLHDVFFPQIELFYTCLKTYFRLILSSITIKDTKREIISKISSLKYYKNVLY